MTTRTTASLELALGWAGLLVALAAGCASSADADSSIHAGGVPGSAGIGSPEGGASSDVPILGGSDGAAAAGGRGSDNASSAGMAGRGGAFEAGGSGSDASGESSAGSSGASAAAGPSFAKYDVPVMVWNGETYSNNGTLTSLTFHHFVENTGASGTAPVTVTYQGYTETTEFAVDSGVRYVLGSTFPITPADDLVHTCTLSTVFPGLTLTQELGNASVRIDNPRYGTCSHVAGPSTSYLIPLSSCICSGGCSGTFASQCENPCGLPDSACSTMADAGR